MTNANQPLAERVATRRDTDTVFSPAVAEALRLAELFEDVTPEHFGLPVADTLDGFRPMSVNRMLFKAT